ncbi:MULTISPECIES: hypothetical protein [Planktothrix]|uniref:Uncharacterized protein n=1 Tax=Planktothrix tepida PCC 9214 TaxID=671072 RepID=A0A1J1LG24_9CYAN|nr:MULTISPECIES: hypothetical protein [Planktothrix]CUR30852.1 hypothetical protein PL9214290443 [Planktothrix tepida PCC 9214]
MDHFAPTVGFSKNAKPKTDRPNNKEGQDRAYEGYVTQYAIARNQKLIATFDALSLGICMGVSEEQQFE